MQNLESATTSGRVEHPSLEYSFAAFHSLRWVVLRWIVVRLIIVVGIGHEYKAIVQMRHGSPETRNICCSILGF